MAQKGGNSILVRVAKLLRLSIYSNEVAQDKLSKDRIGSHLLHQGA